MLNLNDQVQILSQEAPNYGVPPLVIEQAIAPVLIGQARKLKHLSYFVLQSRDREWQTTTLSHRNHPAQEKTVLYAFAGRQEALSFSLNTHTSLEIIEIPVIDLLFQLLAMTPVDSLILLDIEGNLDQGKEIQRQGLQHLIEKHLRRLPATNNSKSANSKSPTSKSRSIPSNWA
jgi:hypothetical protein